MHVFLFNKNAHAAVQQEDMSSCCIVVLKLNLPGMFIIIRGDEDNCGNDGGCHLSSNNSTLNGVGHDSAH